MQKINITFGAQLLQGIDLKVCTLHVAILHVNGDHVFLSCLDLFIYFISCVFMTRYSTSIYNFEM